ncbi:uncharacterized protein LOC135197218 [Macrobrachium nipponense]|uniref:uncharacterized protein LOC135197218 n=1 Tax=Macrobrachium nipponense TaxID=159736 RepID=UPI0030C88257
MAEVEAALVLLDDLPSKERRACLELLIRIFGNVVKSPDEPKYRLLKITNKTFKESVWEHECGRAVMQAAGWEVVGETVQLPPYIDLQMPLEVLLANRNVKPDERDWVEETKVVVKNPAQVRDEELRKKALMQKEKELAALMKEKAERKAIAERIRAEHRSDQENKRITKASVAVPRGKGEIAKMSDRLPKGG